LSVTKIRREISTAEPNARPDSREEVKEMNPLYKILVVVIVALLSILSFATGDDAVSPKIIEKFEAFTMIGISVRTNNAKERTPDGLIGKQWQRLFQENLLSKIPSKGDGSIVAAYTDYASDKDGDYTFVLGARVNSDKEVPAGMIAVKIPSGRYAVFTSEKGPSYKVVPELWRRIWAIPKSAPGGNRAYKTDFEVYDQRAVDSENSQIDVCVGLQ
jgi:predicted transcriptional regulator YdeE